MKIDKEKLEQIHEKWNTKELLKAVTADKKNYDPVALDIMNRELNKRHIDDSSQEEFQKTYSQEKQAAMNSGKLFCPKCYCLNIEKQKRLWAFFLIGPLVYLLIPRYQCLECGYQFRDSKIENQTTEVKK